MRYRCALLAAALLLAHGETARAESAGVRFRSPGFDEELTLFGLGARGFLTPSELGLLSHLMRCRRTGEERRIDPVLARTLVRIARHFGREVVVVSGYRARPLGGRRRSHHLRGRAADLRVPGVPTRELRDVAVRMGIPGIGFYPHLGFVHVDVRVDRYWWVDYSGPGRRGPVLPDPEGSAPDDQALLAGR